MPRLVRRRPPWCRCVFKKGDGYTNRGDGVWVHDRCMKPRKPVYDSLRAAQTPAA